MTTLPFGQLPIGTAFEFGGRQYRKIALSMTTDDTGCGTIFMSEALVRVEAEITDPLPWKPDAYHWADRLSPSCITLQNAEHPSPITEP